MGGQALNTASAMGRFFLNVMAGFAELEHNLIAERTAAAVAHKKAHGQAYNHTPYGFERQGALLLADGKEQHIIRLVADWSRQGWSLRRIATELDRRAVPTEHGARWHASTVRNILLGNRERGDDAQCRVAS